MGTAIEAINQLCDELPHYNVRAGRSAPPLELRRLLETADDCTVVKSNPRRQVFVIRSGGRRFFLKCSTAARRKDRLRHALLPRRRKAEWRNLHRLAARGIAAPEPLFRGQAWQLDPPRHFILTAEVPGRSFEPGDHARWRQLGEFVALLHSKGVYHADLHPGNLRLTPGGDYALLDVQSVFFFKPLPRRLMVRNIGRFWAHFLQEAGFPLWLDRFLDGYHAARTGRIRAVEVSAAARAQRERRYRSRTRRCLVDSSEFERVAQTGLKGFRRRGFGWGRAELETALREGRTLKSGRVLAYRGVCIKRRPRRLFHGDRCRTGWIMSRALEVRGIEVPGSLAYFACARETYFLFEYIEDGQSLNDFLSGLTDAGLKRKALKALARWVRRIHSSRLWQRDFKSGNVLHGGGSYIMLDLDSVRTGKPGSSGRIMNLAQLNASIGNAVTLRDRLRFFHFYTSGQTWTRARRREAYRRIWRISRGKHTQMYGLDLNELLRQGGVGRGRR